MVTSSLGKGIILTKEMYRRMGQASQKDSKKSPRSPSIIPYTSPRLDPRNHFQFEEYGQYTHY